MVDMKISINITNNQTNSAVHDQQDINIPTLLYEQPLQSTGNLSYTSTYIQNLPMKTSSYEQLSKLPSQTISVRN